MQKRGTFSDNGDDTDNTSSGTATSSSTMDIENSTAAATKTPSPEQSRSAAEISTILTSTLSVDVHAAAREVKEVSLIHSNAEVFPQSTEYAFTFLQVFTAAVCALAL